MNKIQKELSLKKKPRKETTKTAKGKRVLCIYCKKPIHIDAFAGVSKKGMFCNNSICLMELAKESKNE